MSKRILQTADGKLDYGVEWEDWLPTGVTIASSEWEISDQVLGVPTLSDDGHDTTETWVTVTGIAVGTTYTLTNKVTLSDGQIDERSIYIKGVAVKTV